MCRVPSAMEMGTLVTKETLQSIVAIAIAKGKFRSDLLNHGGENENRKEYPDTAVLLQV